MTVHSTLGPGLLESAYQTCLILELRHAGLQVDVNVAVPVLYRGVTINCGYRLDLLLNGLVVIELKTVTAILPVHEAQLVTYLKLTGKPVGLLFNFNVPLLKDGGIRRKINTQIESWAPAPGRRVGRATVGKRVAQRKIRHVFPSVALPTTARSAVPNS